MLRSSQRNAKLKELKGLRMEELKKLGEAIGKLWSEVRQSKLRRNGVA